MGRKGFSSAAKSTAFGRSLQSRPEHVEFSLKLAICLSRLVCYHPPLSGLRPWPEIENPWRVQDARGRTGATENSKFEDRSSSLLDVARARARGLFACRRLRDFADRCAEESRAARSLRFAARSVGRPQQL